MTKLTQHDYWNSRADHWGENGAPIIPTEVDLGIQRKYLVPGGDALILGVTPELCEIALQVAGSITAVDFSEDMIEKLRMDDVRYVHSDWLNYLRDTATAYDNILTDGGLTCLKFPTEWQDLADLVHQKLKSGGIFAPRIFVSTDKPPNEQYDNPSLERFVTSMSRANASNDWSIQPGHQDYDHYDFTYSFPPDEVVRPIFEKFELVEMLIPEYDEGARFVTYVFRKS